MIPKFRAWDSVEKKFVEHFFITDNGLICNMEKPTSDYNSPIPIEKSELILMQSTALYDKNGKEIFEGDILGTKDGLLNGVVEYRADLGMFVNTLIRYNNFERLCNIGSDREIIGNVWEDGDLIDSKKTREN